MTFSVRRYYPIPATASKTKQPLGRSGDAFADRTEANLSDALAMAERLFNNMKEAFCVVDENISTPQDSGIIARFYKINAEVFVHVDNRGCYFKRWFPVSTYEEASILVTDFQDRHSLGMSDLRQGHGQIRCDGKIVAVVSYNGKVWPPGEWSPGQEPLMLAPSPNQRRK